jgi:hypothetical protein
MGAERVQQRQGFISGSVPGNSLHEPISIDRLMTSAYRPLVESLLTDR